MILAYADGLFIGRLRLQRLRFTHAAAKVLFYNMGKNKTSRSTGGSELFTSQPGDSEVQFPNSG